MLVARLESCDFSSVSLLFLTFYLLTTHTLTSEIGLSMSNDSPDLDIRSPNTHCIGRCWNAIGAMRTGMETGAEHRRLGRHGRDVDEDARPEAELRETRFQRSVRSSPAPPTM